MWLSYRPSPKRLAYPLRDRGGEGCGSRPRHRKIAVPDRVLLKPSRLTEAEYQEMQTTGVVRSFWSTSPISSMGGLRVAHHERPDGKGYGRGFTVSEIPIGAALSPCDSFDAMTSTGHIGCAYKEEPSPNCDGSRSQWMLECRRIPRLLDEDELAVD